MMRDAQGVLVERCHAAPTSLLRDFAPPRAGLDSYHSSNQGCHAVLCCSGFFDALLRIPREEGLLAMYKGLLPRLMRIAPGQAIVWTVNDQIVGFFEHQQPATVQA